MTQHHDQPGLFTVTYVGQADTAGRCAQCNRPVRRPILLDLEHGGTPLPYGPTCARRLGYHKPRKPRKPVEPPAPKAEPQDALELDVPGIAASALEAEAACRHQRLGNHGAGEWSCLDCHKTLTSAEAEALIFDGDAVTDIHHHGLGYGEHVHGVAQ